MRFERHKAVFYTLRVRLVIWITVAVLIMVVVTMIIVRQVAHRTLQYEFDQVLLGDAEEIDLTLRKLSFEQLQTVLNRKARSHSHQGWFVEIFDEQGEPLWASENTPLALPDPRLDTTASASFAEAEAIHEPDEPGPYRMLLRHLPQNGYWIRLGSSTQSLVADVELLNRIMILACLLIALVAPLGAYALAGRATRPLAWIIATTARLQPQKLDERLPIRGSNDELDQLSSTINGMLDRIASYIERHRDFIANSAHELRSPLAAIRTTVEVALNRPRSTEEYQSLLTDVMIECSRLGNLVNRLLLLAEGDAGRLVSRETLVSLDRLVRESVDMFQAVAESQRINLCVDRLDVAQIAGDEIQLRQVVRNLIDNAIKFNLPPGEVRLEVQVDAEKNLAYLNVSDTGVGISPENLPRIFERFFRGDRSRIREGGPGGYGLGLSMCQLIVRSLGGEITVKSQVGQGSVFTVIFPLAAQAKVAIAAAS